MDARQVSRIALLVIAGLCALLLAAELWAIGHNGELGRWIGADYTLYMDATRRWLSGGSFYVPAHVAAPFQLGWGAVLYPPQALLVFAPFTVLPWPLWYAIPIGITGSMIWWHRPALWGWVAMVAVVTAFPLEFLIYPVGTPTIWFVAVVALATRWSWMSALILVKPSIFPFALPGLGDKRWWATVAVLIATGLLFWDTTLEWLRVMQNQRGANLLYSQGNVWVLLIPVVAWASGVRRRRHAWPAVTRDLGRARGGRTTRHGARSASASK